MRLWNFIRLALVLYMCTSGMLNVLPLYGWITGDLASVSSGMTWGSVWGGFLFNHSGVIVTISFLTPFWCGIGYVDTVVAVCCVISLWCGVAGVSNLGSWARGGGDGDCGTSMLNMAASCFSAAVCFYPSCRIGHYGYGFWRASVRSAAVLVTACAGERIGNFFWTGKSSFMPDTCYDAILGMYDVRHL